MNVNTPVFQQYYVTPSIVACQPQKGADYQPLGVRAACGFQLGRLHVGLTRPAKPKDGFPLRFGELAWID